MRHFGAGDIVKRLFVQGWKALKSGYRGNVQLNEEMRQVNKTVEKWDRSDSAYLDEGFKAYWELLDEVQRHQAVMMAGGRDIIEYLASFFPEDMKMADLKGLVIGCMYGEDTPAIAFAKTGAFRELLVVDIAEGLLKKQKNITDKLGLGGLFKYKRMDLNAESILPAEYYDFILAIGTIHHITRLEGLCFEINDALLEHGVFCMKEYVGPSYLQFTEKQIQLCNEILSCLPDHLKRQRNGGIKMETFRPAKNDVIADDPSEAVRSEDILGIVQRSLNVLALNWTGGTLLHPLLDGIAGNFENGDKADHAILRTIILFERTLIESGVIPSDYVFLVAKKT